MRNGGLRTERAPLVVQCALRPHEEDLAISSQKMRKVWRQGNQQTAHTRTRAKKYTSSAQVRLVSRRIFRTTRASKHGTASSFLGEDAKYNRTGFVVVAEQEDPKDDEHGNS